MDIEQYTNFKELVSKVEPRFIAPILLVFGTLVVTAIWRRMWWLLFIIVAMPLGLYFLSVLLPMNVGLTYRLFFMGILVLGLSGFAYYLKQ